MKATQRDSGNLIVTNVLMFVRALLGASGPARYIIASRQHELGVGQLYVAAFVWCWSKRLAKPSTVFQPGEVPMSTDTIGAEM